ncbi:MAG TPA: aminotransferase class III-fold pyridoxal phosphate-dependent enzyme [Candidatus Kapabacteria bacterium]|nr:aminotransferase class III-fold pyridoxal phosphate-dependent enzyme [Candidatus Kapabacteria bacterium]
MANSISLTQDYPVITHSEELYARSLGLIPGHSQTLAKGPRQYVGGSPKYLDHGKGSHVWDVDGNEFIDYQMGIGPLVLGYCFEPVDTAIKAQLEKGITFSLVSPLEVEVAEMIRDIVPNAEMVRYSKTGCDATTAAVRLARAFTGREKVLCCGYHGWHDWYIGVTDRNRGIPKATQDLSFTFNYNDISSVLESIDENTACVILEPIVFEAPKNNFLQELKEVCERFGALLIFDEMWTGFRLALGGAQQYFGVKADLACFSKAVANGMPISIICGRSEVMQLCEKDIFFFTTFGGEALSLAATKATIGELKSKNVPEHLAIQGKKLREGYNSIAEELDISDYTKCSGFDCRTIITFDAKAGNPLELKSLVQQEMIKRGVLWGGFHNMSFSHSDEDVAYTLSAYREALAILKNAVTNNTVAAQLRGEAVEPVFRRTSNFNMKPKAVKA